MCVDLALKVFLAEKVGKGKGVSRDCDVFSYCNERINSLLLKYSQLSISQSRS